MSEVLARFRSNSRLKFINEAQTLSMVISKLVFRNKVFPKKYRNYYGNHLMSIADKILINCVTGNNFEPINQENCEKRIEKQTEVLGLLDSLELLLINVEVNIPTVTITTLKPIIESMDKLRVLIEGWKKSTIVKKNSFV